MATRPVLTDLDVSGAVLLGHTRSTVLGSDQSFTSNTTLAAILTLASVPAGTYRLEALLGVTGGQTGDSKIAIDLPSGSSGLVFIAGYGSGVSGLSGGWPNAAPQRFSGSPLRAGPVVCGVVGTGTDEAPVLIIGRIVLTTTGDVVILGAQNTSNGTATVFEADSYAMLTRIA